MKFLSIALLWALNFSTFSVLAADIPARIDISYSITSGALEGEANDSLEIKQENGQRTYAINSETRAKGLLTLTQPDSVMRISEGIVTAKGLMHPSRFSDQHGDRLPKVAIFDWDKKLLTLQYKGREEQKTLPADTQDQLSMLYSFMFSPLSGKVINLHETDGKKLKQVHYAISKETLETPIGKLETIVLTKQKGKDGERDNKIWLAVDYYMLPVRIVATQKIGLVTDQMVTEINYADNP